MGRREPVLIAAARNLQKHDKGQFSILLNKFSTTSATKMAALVYILLYMHFSPGLPPLVAEARFLPTMTSLGDDITTGLWYRLGLVALIATTR